MDTSDILRELNSKIEVWDKTVMELRSKWVIEQREMDEINNQMSSLRSKYEMKRLTVGQMTKKWDEKTKIWVEARKAYNKIVENTTKLIEAVSNESINDKGGY